MTSQLRCALCLRHVSALRDSHILPRWVFKRAGKASTPPSATAVNIIGKKAIRGGDQGTHELLCGECEQLLGDDENYVAQVAHKPDGSSKLLELLAAPNASTFSGEQVAVDVPSSVNICALVRFGLSVIWRASVTSPPKRSFRVGEPGTALGPEYEEAVRAFLLGRAPFPPNARLLLEVLAPRRGDEPLAANHTSSTFPGTERVEGMYRSMFLVHGLCYQLWISKKLGSRFDAFSLAPTSPRVILTRYGSLFMLKRLDISIKEATAVGAQRGWPGGPRDRRS